MYRARRSVAWLGPRGPAPSLKGPKCCCTEAQIHHSLVAPKLRGEQKVQESGRERVGQRVRHIVDPVGRERGRYQILCAVTSSVALVGSGRSSRWLSCPGTDETSAYMA